MEIKHRFILFLSCALPLIHLAGTLQEDMTLYLDGESLKPKPPVEYISSSIRLREGRFGKGLLIERRTVNTANPEDFVLGEGATVTPKNNGILFPAHGFAAIPQTGLRPKSSNILSLRYKGEGDIHFQLWEEGDVTPLATLTATGDFQSATIRFFPKTDAASLKIRTEKSVQLDSIMVDRNIDFANTYHAPGKMRNVDVIRAPAQGVFDPSQGALSFWLKAPWFRPGGEASGMAVMNMLLAPEQQKKLGGAQSKVITVWGDKDSSGLYDPYMIDGNYGVKSSVVGSFRMSEIPVVNADGWVHVAICWSLKDGILTDVITINGTKSFTRSGKFTPFPPIGTIEIGYCRGAYTNGILDDFAIFRRPLTQEEIRRIATSDKPLAELK